MAQENHAAQTPVARASWYARTPTLRSLQQRDWRILWLAGHLWHIAFWMDLLVLSWLVLEMTDSPLAVSLVGTFRFLPLGVFGYLFGSLGDRFSKRHLLVLAQVVNASTTIALTIVLLLGKVQLWHIYGATTMMGFAWAADFPIRRAFIRELVPDGSLINAMSLDAASLMGMNMVGRFVGGGQLALVDASGAYVFLSLCYIAGLVLLLRVTSSRGPGATGIRPRSVLRGLKDGLQYAVGNPALRGVLIVTVVFNLLLSPYIQLTPVFARDVLGVGPALLGLMSGMDGFGALLGALVVASAGGVRPLGLIFLLGTLTAGLAVFLFSLSTVFVLSLAMLFLAGLGLSGFGTMQTTITASVVRPEMRARAMGVLTLAIGVMPLGMTYMGFLADRLGAPKAVALNSLACVGLVLALVVLQPGLRKLSA